MGGARAIFGFWELGSGSEVNNTTILGTSNADGFLTTCTLWY